MTNHYCFHLGREEDLSITELEAFFGGQIEAHGKVGLISEESIKKTLEKLETVNSPQQLLNQIGGSTKLSKVIDGIEEVERDEEKFIQVIIEALEKQKPEGKLHFGLNILPEDDDFLNDLLKKIKQEMKSRGRNARFLNKKGNLNTATIAKGGLMKDQTDFNLLKLSNKILLTQTIAVQDFAAYSLRDYEKPARLAKSGMLPPKLAQTMINLTSLVSNDCDFEGKTLYDPFCGSGTVLGEGLIKGMNVIGSDLSEQAIKAAKKNLDWLRVNAKNSFKWENLTDHIFLKDAQTITIEDLPTPPDMIVAETYLGPPTHTHLPEDEIYKIQEELIELYLNFFKVLHPLLNPGTPIVIAFPIHHTPKKTFRLPNLVDQIIPIGYKLNRSLVYHRKQQAVGREILILQNI